MKKQIILILLITVSIITYGQGVITRTAPVSATTSASNYNKQVISDANLKIALTLGIPYGTSYTLNNANPEAGKLFYNTTTGKLGIFNGTSWSDVGGDNYNFSQLFSVSGNNVTIDTTKIRTVLNSWSKSEADQRYMKISDGLISVDSIGVSGLNVTVYAPVLWRINGINYNKNTNTVISINAATPSYNRIDLIYATTSNAILKIQGVETAGVAVEPNLPPNSIRIAPVYITGSTISPPLPDLSGYVTYPALNESLEGYAKLVGGNSFLGDQNVNGEIYTTDYFGIKKAQFTNRIGSAVLSQDRVFNLQDADGTVAYIENFASGQTIGANTTGTALNATNWVTTFVTDFNSVFGFKLLRANAGTVANQPVSGKFGDGIQFSPNNDNNYISQLVYDVEGVLWSRSKYDGIWGSWIKIATSNDISSALGVTVNSAANPLALSDRGYYNYTGSTNATWNLPASPPVGRFYRIYNMGTGGAVLTVNGSGNNVYQGGTTSSTITLNVGENLTLQFTGLVWASYGN